jgi:hypothetical protein
VLFAVHVCIIAPNKDPVNRWVIQCCFKATFSQKKSPARVATGLVNLSLASGDNQKGPKVISLLVAIIYLVTK